MLHVWCDGSIVDGPWGSKDRKHLPPHGYAGWVVKTPEGEHVHHHALDLGDGPGRSGNFSEYLAVRSALFWLKNNRPLDAVVIHSDSQLIVNQMSGNWNCFVPGLVVLRDACRALAAVLPSVRYKWVPREENREADVLSKALVDFGYVPTWQEVQEALWRLPTNPISTIHRPSRIASKSSKTCMIRRAIVPRKAVVS